MLLKSERLVDDRGVCGVLEQVGIHSRKIPTQPRRHAEVDANQVPLRVSPDEAAAIAGMPEGRQRRKRAVSRKSVTRSEDIQAVAIAATREIDLDPITGCRTDPG